MVIFVENLRKRVFSGIPAKKQTTVHLPYRNVSQWKANLGGHNTQKKAFSPKVSIRVGSVYNFTLLSIPPSTHTMFESLETIVLPAPNTVCR